MSRKRRRYVDDRPHPDTAIVFAVTGDHRGLIRKQYLGSPGGGWKRYWWVDAHIYENSRRWHPHTTPQQALLRAARERLDEIIRWKEMPSYTRQDIARQIAACLDTLEYGRWPRDWGHGGREP